MNENFLNNVFSIREAAELWGVNIESLRTYLKRGAKGWEENVDYKYSSGIWIVTRTAMDKRYKK